MPKVKDQNGKYTFSQKADKKYLDKNWLYNQYITLQKSYKKIGDECNVEKTTIGNQIRKFKIPIRKSYGDYVLLNPKPYMNKEWLEKEYSTKTTVQIGKENNVCSTIIPRWLRRFGIPVRDIHQSRLGKFHYKFNGDRLIYNGYWSVYRPEHPKAIRSQRKYYVLEHIIVMEKHLGRYLTDIEVVHHRDGNKLNNDISNLQLFPNSSEHIKYEMFCRDFVKKLLFGDMAVSNREELLLLFNEFVNEH